MAGRVCVRNVVDKEGEGEGPCSITPSVESPYDRKNPIPKEQGLEDGTCAEKQFHSEEMRKLRRVDDRLRDETE